MGDSLLSWKQIHYEYQLKVEGGMPSGDSISPIKLDESDSIQQSRRAHIIARTTSHLIKLEKTNKLAGDTIFGA